MTRPSITALFGLLTAASAHAAVVSFDPPEVAFDPAAPDRVYEFDLWVNSETLGDPPRFTTLDALIGSTAMELLDFRYTQRYIDGTALEQPPRRLSLWSCDNLFVGGFGPHPQRLPLLVGTLSARFDVNKPSWLRDSQIDAVFVDSKLDGGFSGIVLGPRTEPLYGSVRLVPEPAAVLLLLCAAGMILTMRRPARAWRRRDVCAGEVLV